MAGSPESSDSYLNPGRYVEPALSDNPVHVSICRHVLVKRRVFVVESASGVEAESWECTRCEQRFLPDPHGRGRVIGASEEADRG